MDNLTIRFQPGDPTYLRVSYPVHPTAEVLVLSAADQGSGQPLRVSGSKGAAVWSWAVQTTGNQLVRLRLSGADAGPLQQVGLASARAQTVLATQARKTRCACRAEPLRQLALYNGLLEVAFHEQDFAACRGLLQLLDDLEPCPC